MKKLIFIVFSLAFLVACTTTRPEIDTANWDATNQISPEYGVSPELAEKFAHWPNYEGVYDSMGGAWNALRWCKHEASLNYEYRKGTYDPDEKRNYYFFNQPASKGAPRRAPSDPQWIKDCMDCMEAMGFEYTGPME